MIRPVGVVLAGGAGRRMGRPKGGLVFRGTTLTQRAALVLRPLCERVYVSVAPGGTDEGSGAEVIEDSPPAGRGPLAGLAAAFAATGRADLLVLACDYPFVETPLCRALLTAAGGDADVDVAFPVDSSGRAHPLVALWRRRTEPAIAAALGRGEHAVRAVVGVLRVRELGAPDFGLVDIDPLLANWNTPEESRKEA